MVLRRVVNEALEQKMDVTEERMLSNKDGVRKNAEGHYIRRLAQFKRK